MNLKTQVFPCFFFLTSHTYRVNLSLCVRVRACVVRVVGLGGGEGGVGVWRGTGVNLLWQDVALLPHESD